MSNLEVRIMNVESAVNKHGDKIEAIGTSQAVLNTKMNIIAFVAGVGVTVGATTLLAVVFHL